MNKKEYNVNELWLEIGRECGGTALMVYLSLLSKRDIESNACNPSLSEIGEQLGIVARTMSRNLKLLFESGYLLIDTPQCEKDSNFFFPKEPFYKNFEHDLNQQKARKRMGQHRREKIEPISAGIYLITNTETGAQYVGQAVNIRSRWIQHIQELRTGKHCNKTLQEDFNKYGEDSFDFKVLEIVEDSPVLDIELDRKENKWGKKYHVLEEGYNKAHFIDPFKQH